MRRAQNYKAPHHFEEKLVQTPHGHVRKLVFTTPREKPRRSQPKPTTSRNVSKLDKSSSQNWDHNPFLDDDRDSLLLADSDQHTYISEFLQQRPELINKILQLDCLANSGLCHHCHSTEGWWRCLECFGCHASCRDCLRKTHAAHPFHRIQFWRGTHYEADWLCNIGVTINLGHSGKPCPRQSTQLHRQPYKPALTPILALKDYIDPYASPSEYCDTPDNAQSVTVIHTNGIHKVWIQSCLCHDKMIEHLLALALFPATFKSPQTLFTFSLLDDFRKANLECQTTSYAYFHKLQRMNSEFFPKSAPDRYREFNRVTMEWRNLKEWKWAGVPYDYPNQPLPTDSGLLALFCSSCPQPGINLPINWKSDPDQLAYTRVFVSDGNFSAVHQKRDNPRPEKALTNGDLFMVEETKYAAHLKVAVEMNEKSTCNEHHAVNDRFLKHKGLDVTGIGATACSRHGAFLPGGVVNFQKGERQMNMDYSICHGISLSNIGDIPKIISLYDINCQYSVNFEKRVRSNSSHLSYPFDKETIWGIGEFHVNGHIPKCFPRHSPQFIPGAANTDGERLESLWSDLNDVFISCQGSTLMNRTQMLDTHFLNSNWKKTTGIVSTVITAYQRAVTGAKESEEYFHDLSKNIDSEKVKEWNDEMVTANLRRMKGDISAMDIYDVQLDAPPTFAQKQLQLTEEEGGPSSNLHGAVTWLAEGLKIEEAQLLLASEVRRHYYKTDEGQLMLVQKRLTLDRRINKHQRNAGQYIPEIEMASLLPASRMNVDDGWQDEEEGEENSFPTSAFTFTHSITGPEDHVFPENRPLLLPWNISVDDRNKFQLKKLAKKELHLRQGQANDALQAIRLGIGEKSFRFRNQLRPAKSKGAKTRAWTLINSAGKKLQEHRLIYRQARQAMVSLSASASVLETYKDLSNADMNTSTAVQESNARGQRNKELSWIWRTPGIFVGDEKTFITELMRVNWIRAKSRRDRWKEELSVTKHEMVWVLLWFQNHAKVWMERAKTVVQPELQPYAHRQAANWERMKRVAHTIFMKKNSDLAEVFGYNEIL